MNVKHCKRENVHTVGLGLRVVIEKAVNVVWSTMVWDISDCPGTEQNINIKGGIYNFQKVGVWVQVLSRVALNARKQKFGYW